MPRENDLVTWVRTRLQDHPLGWTRLPEQGRKAVVGLDGTAQSLAAVAWASRLAEEVHLVTATGLSASPVLQPHPPPPTSTWAEAIDTAVEAAAAAVERALGGTPSHRHRIEAGPTTALLQVARETGAELLVVGRGQKGRLERAYLGSVAEALVHHAPAPVLVARGPPEDGPVLAAVGHDAGSPVAAAWATALALWLERPLLLAEASASVDIPKVVESSPDGDRAVLVPWPPRQGVADLARAEGACVLVVGQSGQAHWLGSNATALVRHAPCSVLVARPPDQGGP